jgi:uncharacterized protein
MSEHPNVTSMRTAYEGFAKGDLESLAGKWTAGIRWHEPGRHPLAGDFVGAPAIFAFFGRLLEATEGTLRVEPQTLLADDATGVAVVIVTARRGGRALETMAAHISRFDADGKVVEFWSAPTDQELLDRFLA